MYRRSVYLHASNWTPSMRCRPPCSVRHSRATCDKIVITPAQHDLRNFKDASYER